jgi:branched-chain amino acid transport system permease protein
MKNSRSGSILLLAGLAALAAVPLAASSFYVTLISSALIAAMFALSLNLLVGGTGLVSLGHATFFALAAYSVYFITPASGGLSILVTLPVAIATAAVAALAIGAVSLRTKGFFFLMVTLAFGQMVFFLLHDTKLGGGADGVFVPRPSFALGPWEWRPNRSMRGIAVYYLNLALLVAMYLGLAAVMRSLFGRVLTGIRLNEHRMRSLGYDTYRYKLAAFVLAGALAGVAGHMWTMQKGGINPELAGWHNSAEGLLLILLGGLDALHGPILGALAFTALTEIADLVTERRHLVEGLVIFVIVVALPKGLAGLRVRGGKGHD